MEPAPQGLDGSKIRRRVIKSGNAELFLAMLVVVLSHFAVLADAANRPKLDYVTPLDRLPPAKSAAGNPCAAFGPGFMKVEGSDARMKVDGSFRVDVSGAAQR